MWGCLAQPGSGRGKWNPHICILIFLLVIPSGAGAAEGPGHGVLCAVPRLLPLHRLGHLRQLPAGGLSPPQQLVFRPIGGTGAPLTRQHATAGALGSCAQSFPGEVCMRQAEGGSATLCVAAVVAGFSADDTGHHRHYGCLHLRFDAQ